jgi:hypothetical protein
VNGNFDESVYCYIDTVLWCVLGKFSFISLQKRKEITLCTLNA